MGPIKIKYTIGVEKKPRSNRHREIPPQVSRVARMLALAHHIDRLIEAGSIGSYAEAAQMLGVSRARVTQVIKLLNLSPSVQHSILLGKLNISERQLRHVLKYTVWKIQEIRIDQRRMS